MAATPKVTFVTVCYNTPHLMRVLLRGVERAAFGFPFEYIVVDNGSDGTGAALADRFPWARVLSSGGNAGFAKGNNMAFREASGEYVMLVNPDLTVFPGEMEKLIAFADRNPDMDLIGPRVENPNGTRQETCTRFPHPLMPIVSRTALGKTAWGKRELADYFMRNEDHGDVHEAESLYGCAMLIRRSVFGRVGMFDERYFMYYEDVDFCRRVREHGGRVVYAPVSRFVHYHQRESMIRRPWELFTNPIVRIHIKSGVTYFWKYRGRAHPARLRRHEGHAIQQEETRRESEFSHVSGRSSAGS